MIMNNKGFTLIELMISVSLVSVVLIFTLNLLNDIRAEEDMGSNKTADLTNRTIITKVIQSDFDNHVVHYVGVYNSTTGDMCDVENTSLFASKYDFVPRKCVYVKMDDGCRAIMIGTLRGARASEINYFAYGKKRAGLECNSGNVNDWTVEKWYLSSALYSQIIVDATTNAQENNMQNTLAENLANYAMIIKIPATIADAYATTSMNFDLEFIYYTTDVTSNIPGTTTPMFYNTTSYGRQLKGITTLPYVD